MATSNLHQPANCFSYDVLRRSITLTVHVQPNARSSSIAGLHGDALKIRIAAPAVENKANAAMVDFLGGVLGIRTANMHIRRGNKGRRKTIDISDADEALAARIHATLAHWSI